MASKSMAGIVSFLFGRVCDDVARTAAMPQYCRCYTARRSEERALRTPFGKIRARPRCVDEGMSMIIQSLGNRR